MAIRISYIAPFEYLLDNYGEYVKIKYKGDYDFPMTIDELDEWVKELQSISDQMKFLYKKFRDAQ